MLTSSDLKKIVTEARPIIERQLEDAERLAGLREVVASAGGDWGQLKALIKAQIQDENDDAGDGRRVRKILDKAEYANAYADMLGLAKMNENNFSGDVTIVDRIDTDGNRLTVTVDARVAEILARNSGPPHDPETGEITESDLAETRPDGRGEAESASGEAPDTAPQKSTAALKEVHRSSLADGSADSFGEDSIEEPKIAVAHPTETAWPGEGAGTQALPVDPRAFIKQLRPHCQNPDACGGQGKAHCFSCSVKIKDDPLEAA